MITCVYAIDAGNVTAKIIDTTDLIFELECVTIAKPDTDVVMFIIDSTDVYLSTTQNPINSADYASKGNVTLVHKEGVNRTVECRFFIDGVNYTSRPMILEGNYTFV